MDRPNEEAHSEETRGGQGSSDEAAAPATELQPTPEQESADTAERQPAAGSQPEAVQPSGPGRTRASGIWTAVALAVVVLLLLLIFILQNLRPVAVSYFGASGQLPLGVALLLGAVGGALLVIVAGAARILQLRHQAWRHRRQSRKQQRA